MARFFRWFSFALLVGVLGCSSGPGSSDMSVDEVVDRAAALYTEGDFRPALALSGAALEVPYARLIHRLAQVHDIEHPDVGAGLAGLKALFEDEGAGEAIRVEARLGYARTVQLYQARKMRPKYADVDVAAAFRTIIDTVPAEPQACLAAGYLAETLLYDEATSQQGFDFVESFIAEFEGEEKETVALHMLLDTVYIELRGDYAKAVAHLKRAYAIGIANETGRREALFRIGRMSDLKLGDKIGARKYYEMFLEEYSYAKRRPMVERYLEELG